MGPKFAVVGSEMGQRPLEYRDNGNVYSILPREDGKFFMNVRYALNSSINSHQYLLNPESKCCIDGLTPIPSRKSIAIGL